MTTTASGRKLTSACNGVSVAFPCPVFELPGDLKVYLLDSATDPNSAGTLLSESVDYVLSGSGPSGTAQVTTTIIYPLGKFIRRWRETSRSQGVEFKTGEGVPAATQEGALDRLSLVDEEHDDDFARCISTPAGDVGQVLPTRAALVGKFLAGDVTGALVPSAGTGADAGLRTDLAASIGASLLGFIQAGIGAVARSIQSILRERGVSVVDFGADPTGVADSTAAIQAALNSGAAQVYLPKGAFKWSSVSVPALERFKGAGRGTTVVPADNVSNLITVDGQGVEIRGFQIAPGVQRTGGCYIKVNQPGAYLGDLFMTKGFKLIDLSGAISQITLENLTLLDNNNNGASELILIDTPGGVIVLDKVFMANGGLQPLAGVRVRQCADVRIQNSNIVSSGIDLMVDPPAGKSVASLSVTDTFLDTATKGLSIKPVGGSVVRAHFHNAWGSSHTGHGFEIDGSGGTIDGVYFVDPQVNLNGGDGIHLVGTVNVRVSGGQGGQNAGSGFYASASASKFSVRGFTAGASDALAGNAYGIKIDAGASDYDVKDNICSGNTTADVVGITPTMASGGAITVPSAGGAFIISGITDIANINGGRDGREITLHFAGALTVHTGTGTATSIRLAGGVNFAVVAGSTLTLRHNGTQWYEKARAA